MDLRPRLLRNGLVGAIAGAVCGAFLAASAPYRIPWLDLEWSVTGTATLVAMLGALAGIALAIIDVVRLRARA